MYAVDLLADQCSPSTGHPSSPGVSDLPPDRLPSLPQVSQSERHSSAPMSPTSTHSGGVERHHHPPVARLDSVGSLTSLFSDMTAAGAGPESPPPPPPPLTPAAHGEEVRERGGGNTGRPSGPVCRSQTGNFGCYFWV